MKLCVPASFLKDFKGDRFQRLLRFHDDRTVDLDADSLTDKHIDALFDLARTRSGVDGAKGLLQKITSYRAIRSAPDSKKIGKLDVLAAALRAYIAPTPNKWLFCAETDGFTVPYYVHDITYRKNEGRDEPAHVQLRTAAITRGKSDGRNVSFYVTDLGKTVSEILGDKNFYLETPDAVAQYFKDVDVYHKYASLTGAQFRCTGIGYPAEAWSYHQKAMERDGLPATVVMDDVVNDDGSSRSSETSGATTSSKFWAAARDDKDPDADADDDDPGGAVVTPVHPYVKIFDLDQHEFVLVHVRNLSPYVYDKSAADKLVLPEDTKNLVTILVQGSAEILEDIVQGKTGGTIVIATGPPGTGKTLTAEVFAEEIERPLYVVQCSQLGTDEENVEKELRKVLRRASRWRAILLIDEADVYVHERGDDIQQNAIVGVFLRVLERYRGVLFLTSNRATIIDDAIMSRATAWIRYEYPDRQQIQKLWTVLSTQYKTPLTSTDIFALVQQFPTLSGRNIKSLLRLGKMLSRAGAKRDPLDLFKYVSRFLDLRKDTSASP
jgi:hypothetical protein